MSDRILESVNNARDFFDIKKFPGNFFTALEKKDYIDDFGILLFKEDIGKLSGFIGYGEGQLTVICINYKRPIGHQNFTFAHELGHWFLHKGQSISDVYVGNYTLDKVEKEANDFAIELLYPQNIFQKDYQQIIEDNLLSNYNRAKLGEYIDTLCHRYCLSFEVILRKILYKNMQASNYGDVKKEIEKSLGGKISECFERDFYVPNDELPEYKRLMVPYGDLKNKLNVLVSENKIGRATAESIMLRNGIDIN